MPLPKATRNNVLWLALIFIHPIWLVTRLSASIPDGAEAYLLELVLCALLLTRLGAFPSPDARPWAPRTLRTTLAGLHFTVEPHQRARWIFQNALIVTFVSAAGMMMSSGVSAYLDPETYSDPEQAMPAGVHQVWVLLGTGLTQGFLVGVVVSGWLIRLRSVPVSLEGRLLKVGKATLPLSGRATCTLGGGSLTVRDEAGTIEVPGPPSWLLWLAQQIEAVEPAGDEADVPDAIRQVTRSRATE